MKEADVTIHTGPLQIGERDGAALVRWSVHAEGLDGRRFEVAYEACEGDRWQLVLARRDFAIRTLVSGVNEYNGSLEPRLVEAAHARALGERVGEISEGDTVKFTEPGHEFTGMRARVKQVSYWRNGVGLDEMFDLEFDTIGVLFGDRRNPSVRCGIVAFERVT